MIERVEIPRGGINIPEVMSHLDERCSAYLALVEHRTRDGKLDPIRVDIDRVTWEITASDDWTPIVAAQVIVALERGEHPFLKSGRGYHQNQAAEPTDEVPGYNQ